MSLSQIVLCAVWRQQLHGCTTDAPHPDPQAADCWLNSWIPYLETGSVHCIHLIPVSIFLKHKQSKPVKLHIGKGHTVVDRWGKLHPAGLLYKWLGLDLMSWIWSPQTVVSIQQHMVQMQISLLWGELSSPTPLTSHCLTASWHPNPFHLPKLSAASTSLDFPI